MKVAVDPLVGRGSIFLVPELGRCRRSASALRAAGIRVPEGGTGSYRFSIERTGSGNSLRQRLLLTIDNGSAVVEWNQGELSVFALGREIRDSGTVFAVLVDSAARRAFVYVLDGVILMPGTAAGLLRATRGGGYTFGPTAPGQVASSPDAPRALPRLGDAFVSDVGYHRVKVWEQPGRFPWGRVIIGGGLAAGTTYYLMNRGRRFNGSIVLRIPL